MIEEIPDTALAQSIQTLTVLRPVALACIGAGSVIEISRLILTPVPGVVFSLAITAVMAVLGFAAYRQYLSKGHAPILSLGAVLVSPGFGVFLMLELFVTSLAEIIYRVGLLPGVPGVLVIGLWIALFIGLARFGTIFPAIVTGDDTSPIAAAARETTRPLVWRLVAAQCLLIFMVSSLIMLPGTAFEQGLGMGSILGLAIMTPLMMALTAFGTVLFAVILSKAYQGDYQTPARGT